MLCYKGKLQDNQCKQTNKDEVRTEYKRIQKQIPPRACLTIFCEFRVLSWCQCDGSIPRLHFCRLWCVILCDLQTSRMRWPLPALGCCTRRKKIFRRWTDRIDISVLFYGLLQTASRTEKYLRTTPLCCTNFNSTLLGLLKWVIVKCLACDIKYKSP